MAVEGSPQRPGVVVFVGRVFGSVKEEGCGGGVLDGVRVFEEPDAQPLPHVAGH